MSNEPRYEMDPMVVEKIVRLLREAQDLEDRVELGLHKRYGMVEVHDESYWTEYGLSNLS